MEDRTVEIPCFGLAEIGDIIDGTKFLFVDGEARYGTLGDQERILCFGATWNDAENEFEVRYQHERVDLEIRDSIHEHIADNVTLVQGSKPEPNEGDKNGKDNSEKGNPN